MTEKDEILKSNLQLQDKVADLTIAVKGLTQEVSELVKLFREAGENIKKGKYEDPMFNKLNELLEQNKSLAKGLLLLEDYVKTKSQL